MMQDLATWLARKPKGRAPKKPLPKRTKKRAAEERLYRKLAMEYLIANPICQVWLKENGWTRQTGMALGRANGETAHLLTIAGPRSTELHHRAKRRGKLLCDTRYFLAVCSANHAKIEQNLGWARKEGFSLNF